MFILVIFLAEPNLYYNADDDDLLKVFLRPCKFYPESALALVSLLSLFSFIHFYVVLIFKICKNPCLTLQMKRVANFRDKYDLIKSVMPEDEKEAMLNCQAINVLANRDQDGRRVLLNNIGNAWDTKKYSGDTIFKLLYLVQVAATLEPETQVRGCVVIMDFEGLGMKQIAQLTPSFSLRLLSFIQVIKTSVLLYILY